MYEEVTKKLRRCTRFKCRGCEYEYVVSCRARLNEDAASAIEALNRALDWIPVTERLPKVGEEVLLCFRSDYRYDRISIGHLGEHDVEDNNFRLVGTKPVWYSHTHAYYHDIDTVLAWMHLPEAYREDGDNDV